MASGLELSIVASYFLYFSIITLSAFFAYLADKFAKKDIKKVFKVNKFFWLISFFISFIPVAFRGYGVDYTSYLNIYNSIKSAGLDYFINNYNGMPEPLYALLNYLVANTISDFQLVLVLSSLIPLIFIYITFARYVKKVNMFLLVWVFNFTFYFYMYGLVRMSIAVGIITYAYKYLRNKKLFKYSVFCLLATLFHYSAIIMLPVYFLVNLDYFSFNRKNQFSLLRFIVFTTIIIPIIFLAIIIIFPLIANNFSWFVRYSGYFTRPSNWRVINNIAFVWPLLFLILIFKKYIVEKIDCSIFNLKLVFIMLGFGISSIFFPIHRITYYLYPAAAIAYSYIPKLSFKRNQKGPVLIFYIGILLIIGYIWIYISVFGGDLWKPYLIPYYFNF
jgi:hypothetical protein